MIEITASRELVADALLRELQGLLGTEVFDALTRMITRDYLDDEMDLQISIIYRPEVFEHAFIEIIGHISERILECIWNTKLSKEFDLDFGITYQTGGDLAKCIRAIPMKADTTLH